MSAASLLLVRRARAGGGMRRGLAGRVATGWRPFSTKAPPASLSLIDGGETAASKIYAPEGRRKREVDFLPSTILPEDYGPPHDTRVNRLPQVYTRCASLKDFTQDDVGKWYLSQTKDTQQMPLCLSLATKFLFEACLSEHIMVRQSAFDVMQALNQVGQGAEGRSIGVHGPRGCGKSTTLHLLAQYGFQNDYLVIANRGEDFVRDLLGFITPSSSREGIFMQDRYAREWCKALLESQADKLRRIKLKNKYDYPWKSPPDGPEALGLSCEQRGQTLHDLCTQAALDTDKAGEIVYEVVAELQLATVDECKVLVILDNINVWDMPSQFRRPECAYKNVHSRELSMVDALGHFQRVGPSSGMSVFAITAGGYATLNQSQKHLAEADYTVQVGAFSDDELVACMAHCKASNLITSDVDPFFIARVKGLTGNVPRDVLFDATLT